MRIELEVKILLKLENERMARALHKATEPDNAGCPPGVEIAQWSEGSTLVFSVMSSDVLKAKSTVDDFLRCVISAYRAVASAEALGK